MSAKIFTVATAVQQAVFQDVLMNEIAAGFWKNARPADHASFWKGVEIKVGLTLGAQGFEIPRNYNFVNPDFFKKAGQRMLATALTVDPNMTEKHLKKQLLALNQILGGRMTEIGGQVVKLSRGRKAATSASAEEKKTETKTTSVRKVMANFAPEPTESV